MGTKGSKMVLAHRNGRVDDFTAFGVSVTERIEDMIRFMIITPRTIPANKRKAIALQVDTRLGLIANLCSLLRELDEAHEDTVLVIFMFDHILNILWTILEQRYPEIVCSQAQRTPKPDFLSTKDLSISWKQRPGNALLKQVTLLVETILQCAAGMLTMSEAEVLEIRHNGPTSTMTVASKEIETIRSNLHMTTISEMVQADEVYRNAIDMLVGISEKCATIIKNVDLSKLRDAQSTAHGFQPTSAIANKPATPNSVVKSRSTGNIARRNSDAPRILVVSKQHLEDVQKKKREKEKERRDQVRSLSANALGNISESNESDDTEVTSTSKSIVDSASASSPVKIPPRFDPAALQKQWDQKKRVEENNTTNGGDSYTIDIKS